MQDEQDEQDEQDSSAKGGVEQNRGHRPDHLDALNKLAAGG
jgi:hypothetical protein